MDEFDLIERYFRPLAHDFPGAFSLKDDVARIALSKCEELVVTTDMLLEGVHFFGDEPAHLIAKKILRTNLSDLAAKGASPLCYFLSIGLSDRIDKTWVADFVKGLSQDQKQFGIHLAGGDTTQNKASLVISITAMGLVPQGAMLRREGAKAGNPLYVSGTVGDGALGLALLKGEFPEMPEALKKHAIDRYHLPQPRTELGAALRGIATSAMDISDGLFQDRGHLLNASNVGATIQLEEVPLSPAMQWAKDKNHDRWLELLSSGDDYEILFTASKPAPDSTTQIGKITSENGLKVLDARGTVITPAVRGYRHGRPGRDVGP